MNGVKCECICAAGGCSSLTSYRQSDKEALEPKKEANGDHADGETIGNGDVEGDHEGDVSMAHSIVPLATDRSISPSAQHTEQDELEDDPSELDGGSPAPSSSADRHIVVTASRRNAMAIKAAERAEEEAQRLQKANLERDMLKAKKVETKALSTEKKRLIEEDERLTLRLRELEHEFRSHLFTLRARPFGVDRFGNRVWWMDGLGSSAPLLVDGKYTYGTGRVYLQGVEEEDLDYLVMASECDRSEVDVRRDKEEGLGRLRPGEWGMYDDPDQVSP